MLLSRTKRYLNGSDWVVHTLDRVMKQRTGIGNRSQIVLELAAPPDAGRLRETLALLSARLPALNGTVARDLRLAPYWKIPRQTRTPVPLRVAAPTADLHAACTASANRPFGAATEHLAFDLVSDGARHALTMSFDHRLLDARGAEGLLDRLNRHPAGDALPDVPEFASSAQLTRWRETFLAGRNVNRRIIALAQEPPRALPLPERCTRGYRYRVIACTPDQSTALTERAYREAGYLMESPFLLAVVTHCMHRLFTARGCAGSCDLVPVTVDLRTGKDLFQELFFNHLSYLFYRLPAGLGDDLPGLVAAIKTQMYEQIKAGFPADLARASLLMRIAPLGLLGRLLYLPVEGKMASFAFAHLGRSGFAGDRFLGTAVDNLFHMPCVPIPPGIGFFCNRFADRLNLVIAYLDGLLDDAEADRLEADIRQQLGADPA